MPTSSYVIALLGNPNTGKTTLFNSLAGMRQRVGNYPGVTIATKKGNMDYAGRTFELIDLPGTYSLTPRSPDERVAVDLILGRKPGANRPNAILVVIDASNLERNLYLTTQAQELGVPVVVALNMIDLAGAQGLRLDPDRLSRQLGVPFVPIQANRGLGLERLKQALLHCVEETPKSEIPDQKFRVSSFEFRVSNFYPEVFEQEVARLNEHLGGQVPLFLVRRLLLDVGGLTEKGLLEEHRDLAGEVEAARHRLAAAGCPVPTLEARARYSWIRQAIAGCVTHSPARPTCWTDRIDRVLTHRLWGTLIFLALMFVVFQSIFSGARPLMKTIDTGKEGLKQGLQALLPPGPLASLLCEGVLEGVGSIVVFLPQILILFGFIAILEECGYMARAAFLMDGLMARCGLSGKSFIPMLSSMACAVPGILATRVIDNRRDRLVTILVAPLMSCSARLQVYTLLIGAFLTEGFPSWLPGLILFLLYSLGLVLAPLVARVLKRTLFRGQPPVYILEMPLYQWPSLRTVLLRLKDCGWDFMYRAGTMILAAMIVVWALLYFPRSEPDKTILTLRDPETGESEQIEAASYDLHVAYLEDYKKRLEQRETRAGSFLEKEPFLDAIQRIQEEINHLNGTWKRQSLLGRLGRFLEPGLRPLGWDWKVGGAALASFPAREVVVGTLSIVYNLGPIDPKEVRSSDNIGQTSLGMALKEASWDDNPQRKIFTVPAALSFLVFFALCCQCISTLAVIRRETQSWLWPAFTFTYMTILAYIGALGVYQVGTWISGG